MTASFSGSLGLGSAKFVAGARVPNDTMVEKKVPLRMGEFSSTSEVIPVLFLS